ncbi:MAG: hypothetical protein HRU19_16290 [Pseudobacteriovorax sp.]|nr:hypothetical protein [Pseudobacteriovorax sp.]
MTSMIKFALATSFALSLSANAQTKTVSYGTPLTVSSVSILENTSDSVTYEIKGSVIQGSNSCVAAQNVPALVTVPFEDKVLVSAQIVRTIPEDGTGIFCTLQYDPVPADLEVVVTVSKEAKQKVILTNIIDVNGEPFETKDAAFLLAQAPVKQELNRYCDPVDTMYLGGTPLFNERTGVFTSLEDYLAQRGLDLDCNPISGPVTYE